MSSPFELINEMSPLRAALAYVDMGWPVFPLMPKSKIPFPGTKGHLDATVNPNQVKAWFQKHPEANIGRPMGSRDHTGEWVLDIDAGEGKDGLASLAGLEARYGPLDTLEVETGGGGKHLYFKLPEGGAGNRVGILPNIDVRAEGGYVVLPPSVHSTGRKYLWRNTGKPIAVPEPWLTDLIHKQKTRQEEETDDEGGTAGRVEGWGAVKWWHGARIADGTRNNTLFSIAASAVAKGYADDAVLSLVKTINHKFCDPPEEPELVEKLVKSAVTKDPSFSYTDEGNARLLERMCAGTVCQVREYGTKGWREYDGVKWVPVSEKAIWRRVHSMLAFLREKARRNDDADLAKWVHRCGFDQRITACARQFGSLVEVSAEVFTRGVDLFPLEDGTTLFLGTDGVVHPRASRMEDYSLYAAPVRWNVSAKGAMWDRCVARWMSEDNEMIDFLWRWQGCLLSGRVLHSKLFIAVGETNGGKTTFSEVLRLLMGGFAVGLSTELITNARNFNKDAEKARLLGARLGIFSESAEASELDVEVTKGLTGGDVVKCRPLYGESFVFNPSHKLLLHTNHRPTSRSVDNALVRRLMLVDWCGTIPDKERIPRVQLQQTLLAEGSVWLTQATKGYHRVCKALASGASEDEALAIPRRVLLAVEQYRTDMDMIGQWIEECCMSDKNDPTLRALKSYVWKSYRTWCETNKVPRKPHSVFFEDLLGRGFRLISPKNVATIVGLVPLADTLVNIEEGITS